MGRTSLMTAFINIRVPQLKINTYNNSIQFHSAGNHWDKKQKKSEIEWNL